MKNVLMASSAIVGAAVLAASPAAAQELELSGFQDFMASGGDADADGSDRGFGFTTNTEVHVNGSIMADNGITFGFRVEFEADAGSSNTNTNVDENSIWASGSFGKLEFGQNDGAEDSFMINGSFTGTQFGGVGNPTSNFLTSAYAGAARTTADIATDSGDATKITYTTPNFNGFSAGLSYTPSTAHDQRGNNFDDADGGTHDHIGVGLGYEGEFNGVGLNLGLVGAFGHADEEPEDEVYGIGGGVMVSFAGFSFAVGAGMDEGNGDDDGNWAIDAGIGYAAGPWGFSINGVMSEDEFTDDELIAGSANVDYNLAPGVTVFLTGFVGEEDLGSGDDNDIVAVTSGLRLAF
jgi:hypothetical protein